KNIIDFRSSVLGGTVANPANSFYPSFFINYLSVISKLGRLILIPNRPIFNNVTISFC
ncbi:hypothetical protein LZ31DRAFT_483657, partial [Colletotrichum somersetense]